MTGKEFLGKYHYYRVSTEVEALAEIEQMEVVDGNTVVPVFLPPLDWCLMLGTAYQEIRRHCAEWVGGD